MLRFSPYFGIALALIIGGIAVIASNESAVSFVAPPSAPRVASSTVSVVPGQNALPAALPTEEPKEVTTTVKPQENPVSEETATKVPAKAPATKTSPPAAATAQEPALAATPIGGSAPSAAAFDAAATALRGALVNIMCYAPAASSLHSILGSGIFIDSKGIILTDAHVAQYFLLADRGVSCVIRTGSPATDAYKAALIYISPAWIRANPSVLTQVAPIGTGEYDFALLAVTKSATVAPLPASFPALSLAQTPPAASAPVVIASYGAQFLQTNQIQSALFPTVVFGSVKDVFTFAVDTVDILSLGGSAAAQEGSSGGGVVDANGTLIGSITTSTIEGATDTRSLYAITASYIRSEYEREMGSSIDALLNQPVLYSVADFAQRIPTLESIITAGLP